MIVILADSSLGVWNDTLIPHLLSFGFGWVFVRCFVSDEYDIANETLS
jgi:hypothetical protein